MKLWKSWNKRTDTIHIITLAILFGFFMQMLTDFVEAIYAFGLLSTSIPVEIICVGFLFSPLLFFILPAGLGERGLKYAGTLFLITRVIEVVLDTRWRMLVSGLGVALFLLVFPSLLMQWSHKRPAGLLTIITSAFTVSWIYLVSVKLLNSGIDLSTTGPTHWIGWLFAVPAGIFLFSHPLSDGLPTRESGPGHPSGTSHGIGIFGCFILLYFAYTSPNVISRWTGANYPAIAIALMVALLMFIILTSRGVNFLDRMPAPVLLIWNILFVACLVLTILPHQLKFPQYASGYPYFEPFVSFLWQIPLYFGIILAPVLIIDFGLFIQEWIEMKPSARVTAKTFSLASLFLLIMIFAQVFTTVYDYIPVIGPFFRDKFTWVYLVAGLSVLIPILRISSKTNLSYLRSVRTSNDLRIPAMVVGFITLIGMFFMQSNPAASPAIKNNLKILTFNIQQGYNQYGMKNYSGQLLLLKEMEPDIIALQESDTNRIAGGNSDLVRFFADQLNMVSYYGPKTVPGTFGVALLSRVPMDKLSTFYMYSEGEQTGTIHAEMNIQDKKIHLYITHLGNGGPMIQQQAILKASQGLENVVLMGDFNFRPDSNQYELTTASLQDAWFVKWPEGTDIPGFDLADRIDHIFVSPGTQVLDAKYIISDASDHPAMLAEIWW